MMGEFWNLGVDNFLTDTSERVGARASGLAFREEREERVSEIRLVPLFPLVPSPQPLSPPKGNIESEAFCKIESMNSGAKLLVISAYRDYLRESSGSKVQPAQTAAKAISSTATGRSLDNAGVCPATGSDQR
jgi:hypothetical protein